MNSNNPKYPARIAALSLMQTKTLADLLLKSGEPKHAENVYKALEAAVVVLGISLGHENLQEAMGEIQVKWDQTQAEKKVLH